LLHLGEFIDKSDDFRYYDVEGNARSVAMPAGSLAFTLCQVPVVYELVAGKAWIKVGLADGSVSEQPGDRLDARLAREIFSRSGRITLVRVGVPRGVLRELSSAPVSG
jgi:hypothetical protein